MNKVKETFLLDDGENIPREVLRVGENHIKTIQKKSKNSNKQSQIAANEQTLVGKQIFVQIPCSL